MSAAGLAGCAWVWDVLGDWVLTANVCDAGVGCFASFGEGVVAGVEVLALLGW